MNRRSFSVVVAVSAVVIAVTAPSYAGQRCSGVAVTEARSVSELPTDLRQSLMNTTRGNGLADRGGRFIHTDVIDGSLPNAKVLSRCRWKNLCSHCH
jgi:hypothetical protein